MRLHHKGDRAKLGLVTVVAVVVGLAGATGANAAPGDNLRNAGKCLGGGWRSLHPSANRSFSGPLSCVIFALRGGIFVATPVLVPVPVPDPVPVVVPGF
jgi:hypothetical protein